MRCIYCGGEVLVQPDGGIGICTSCMAENPIPQKEVSAADYERASACLRESRFDEAIALYRELLIANPKDGAVCWGMALSEYGIEYVEDPATGEQLPTLHRLSEQKFSESLYAKKAVELSWNLLDREFYIRQSGLIDSIQSKSLAISVQETPVDVFICYKRSEEGERRTADSRMAADYYRELTRRGYHVFFAEETLNVGEEYEPRIFAALQSAKVMIAIASKKEYYEAVWVRNEWSRYVDLIHRDQQENGRTDRLLIPVYQSMEHGELPEALREMPSYVEMKTSANPRAELFQLVSAHFERGKAEDVSDIRRLVRGSAQGMGDFSESAEKTRILATVRLGNGEYAEAEQLFLRAISQPGGSEDPRNYLGLMMCGRQIPGEEALAKSSDVSIESDPNFQKAFDCAKGKQRDELLKILAVCRENAEWEAAGRSKRSECDHKLEELLKSAEAAETDAAIAGKNGGQSAFAQYRSALRRLEEYEKAAQTLKEKKGFNITLIVFLILGNAAPFIYIGMENMTGKVVSSVNGMMLSLFMFTYLICLWKFMSDRDILNTGCFSYVIRFLLIGFISSMVSGVAIGPFALPVGVAALIGAVAYCFVKQSAVKGVKKKAAEGKRWASAYRNELFGLSQRLIGELNAAIEETAEPYRRYDRNFDGFMSAWRERAEQAVAKKMQKLEKRMDAYERGN